MKHRGLFYGLTPQLDPCTKIKLASKVWPKRRLSRKLVQFRSGYAWLIMLVLPSPHTSVSLRSFGYLPSRVVSMRNPVRVEMHPCHVLSSSEYLPRFAQQPPPCTPKSSNTNIKEKDRNAKWFIHQVLSSSKYL